MAEAVFYFGIKDAKADERWQYWLEHPPAAVVIDVETVSLKERHPLGFAIAFSPYEAFYFQVHPDPPVRALEAISKLLSNTTIVKVAHNWMFDMGVFPLIPVVGDKLDRYNIWDTNIAARLLGFIDTPLEVLCYEVGMEATSARAMLGPGKTMLDLDPMKVAAKCQNDARVTYALYDRWKDEIQQRYGEYFQVEMAVIPILLDISMRGIAIDQKARQELEDKYTAEVDFYRKTVQSFGVDNPGSTQQVGYVLGKRGNFLPFTRGRRQLSTKESNLEFLDDPMAAAILGYRQKSKFLSTYIVPIKGTDRFYTEYYMDTVVGRMNSRNRNIQNIPPDARHMLLPDSGTFTTGDYSREHMFILAQMSQDRRLLEVLYDSDRERNDIHIYTAKRMDIGRHIAKVLNYAVVYGATANTVREQAKIRDIRRCQQLLEDWFRVYTGAADWIKSAQEEGLKSGWALPTLFDRRIRLPEENEDAMKRKAVNYPILGSDGEVIKRAIILCDKRGLGPPIMVITVHDSITWDGDVEKQLPIEELEMIPGFKIPFEVKTTFRWE